MRHTKLGVAIVGCGNIAGPYAANIASYSELELRSVTDLNLERAERLASAHSVQASSLLHEPLADEGIDIIVNLTPPGEHSDITRVSLQAGKHVYSEKPLALEIDEAFDLVSLSESSHLRLACAPATFLGEAQQTIIRMVKKGVAGVVRVVYAEANWGPIEMWHPEPHAFYDIGPLFDLGVYPITLGTILFGPARRVKAYGAIVKRHRVTLAEAPFTVSTPDFVTVLIELGDGVIMRLTATFYVDPSSRQSGMEFHGDEGSIFIDSWENFDAEVRHIPRGGESRRIDPIEEPYPGIEWGRGVLDLAKAIQCGREHRATGAHAAHVVEILTAAYRSIETGNDQLVLSTFDPPSLI